MLLTMNAASMNATPTEGKTSVAGFFPLNGSGRIVYNFNQGWRFHLGDAKGAEAPHSTTPNGKWYAPHTPSGSNHLRRAAAETIRA